MSAKPRTVRDLMSSDPYTLGRNDHLRLADDLMKDERIRHIPILDDEGALCGILTQRDLFRGALVRALGFGGRAEDQMLETLVVKEVMTTEVLTTTPSTPLADAARLMMEKKVGCLPVIDDEKLVGILTEGDFVRLAAERG